jgi:Tfp pilus assembly protein PilF
MKKIPRNAPCPCGSGKKYKKCCLSLHEAKAAEAPSRPVVVETDIDTLSNSVVDLLASGDIGRAEQACQELLRRFPDQVDGLLRLAAVHKAKGDRVRAVEHLRRAVEFMQARRDAFDPELIQSVLDEANALEASEQQR